MIFNAVGISMILRDRVSLWPLNEPLMAEEEEMFLLENGYPIEPHIIDPITGETMAYPHQIAYIDEGVDTLRDITIKEINYIINECESRILIDIEEEGDSTFPLFVEDKVVLTMTL